MQQRVHGHEGRNVAAVRITVLNRTHVTIGGFSGVFYYCLSSTVVVVVGWQAACDLAHDIND